MLYVRVDYRMRITKKFAITYNITSVGYIPPPDDKNPPRIALWFGKMKVGDESNHSDTSLYGGN